MGDVVKLYREHGRQIFPPRIQGTLGALWRMCVGGRYVRKGTPKRLRDNECEMLARYFEFGAQAFGKALD